MAAGIIPVVTLQVLVLGALLTGSSVQASGNTAVFDIGSDLDPFNYAVMMTLVIVGLALFDVMLEVLEEHLHHSKGRFHQRLFHKALKELMILGTISFVLFIFKDQNVYDESNETISNAFDFVNLFLFFVGWSLVIAAIMLVMATSPLKNRWDAYANTPLEKLLDLHAEIVSKPWTWYAAWPPRFYRRLRQIQVLEYHLFRSVFVRLNRSLLTPAFDYARYSASIVNEIIIVFFDVNWASWLLAVVILFITLPISNDGEDGNAQVTAHGAIVFGFVVLVLELVTCGYINYAFSTVTSRMGVVGGLDGIGKVLQELWVEPVHYMWMETASIDVKDLLKAAPIRAPTRQELTAAVTDSRQKMSHAQANFKFQPDTSALSLSTGSTKTNVTIDGSTDSSEVFTASAAVPTSTHASKHASVLKTPCPDKGPGCPGCFGCDFLHLPPGRVEDCDMGGDPFVVWKLRPAAWVVERLPDMLKGFTVKVGAFQWFKTLFGTCTLLKCYYCAFYFAYAIGCATESDTATAILWIVITPVPILLCLIPLAKSTLPIYAQLGCLQGQIVWELVSDIEEQQEMAKQARESVLSKLQETLALKTRECNCLQEAGAYAKYEGEALSPRSRAVNEWFAEWDKDGNGTISRGEMERGLQNLGIFLSETQLKELFRLADPDHSKSIDLDEFKVFLSDLQSLETEPERFQLGLASRLERSARFEESCSVKIDEFGLFTKAFSSVEDERLPDDDARVGNGLIRVRPMVTSGADDLDWSRVVRGKEKAMEPAVRMSELELGNGNGISGVIVERDMAVFASAPSSFRRHSGFAAVVTANESDGVDVQMHEAKTEEV